MITDTIRAQYGGTPQSSLVYAKPYSQHIEQMRFSVGYQPQKFQQFGGKGIPKQHVAHFVETCNNVGTYGDFMVKQFVCSLKGNTFDWSGRWRSPQAAIIPNIHLPMRSLELKNRTSTEDIKSLRLITAIKTPYLPDGRFDLEAYDALMHMQIVNGAEGVIVGGTTGEGHLMSWDEHIMLIGHTVNCFGGSIKVIGNTGSNSTSEAIHATEQGFAAGMHAALHINPYYGKTSLEGLVSHFEAVLSMGPTIIYNVPSRTGQDIPPQVIHKVAESASMAGVKECVGNGRIREYTDTGIVVWSGNDDQCHYDRWGYGATGVISVTSNLVPGLMRELMFGGKNTSLNSKLMPLIEWLFREPNPIGLNTALAQLGVVRPVFQLPYVPLPLMRRLEFVKIVKEIGRENFVGERDVQVIDDDEFILVSRY